MTNGGSHIETIKEIKKDLAAANLKWTAVEKLLPEWRDHAIKTPSGTLELKSLIARQFGLKLNADGHLTRPTSLKKALFKTRSNTNSLEVEPAQAIASSVAKIVSRATRKIYSATKLDARAIRSQIIESSPQKWVSFQSLVAQCWSMGIPVIYLPDFPTKSKKMEGMVTRVGDRPVIILSRKDQPDWMLFILAHELGHIACKHLELTESGTILDETVTEDDGGDQQEKEANKFASEVISHSPVKLTKLMTAKQLAIVATKFGKENNVSPGHIILNAVKHTKVNGSSPWPLAQAALKHLPPEAMSPPVEDVCAAAILDNVDLDEVKDDDLDFLESLKVVRANRDWTV
jgi:Zn-dependent peptidase ImmA (M78 family)